jgi:hypothetical protein
MGRWSDVPKYGLYAGGGLAMAGFLLEIFKVLNPFVQNYGTNDIKHERVYDCCDVARILGTDKEGVLQLIEQDALRATKGADGNYKIIGQSIIDYMSGKENKAHTAPA